MESNQKKEREAVIDLELLDTEGINENSLNIDSMNIADVLKTINEEDKKVAQVIEEELPAITRAVEAICPKIQVGGRLIYVGAGTSGRLGVLDASECPPTYGVEPGLVVGLIAGGEKALRYAIEGAEDDGEQAVKDLEAIRFTPKDALVGLAASGRTPYVLAALAYAKALGAVTVSVSCVKDAEVSQVAQYPIEAVVGPEVVTGSTRMKAGTAQKMILNMISTTLMIQAGKVYGNLMVDVQATNAKLIVRAERIITTTTGLGKEEAKLLFEESGHSVKTAIVMAKKKTSRREAEALLEKHQGRIARALTS
ncbi:N-acetylmuramic acid 6-phosphate etherase [Proteiniclasticum sp. BAD-10]|uniref:N-acetylmuramic acid 6-phosphate etherase n=1 Tax=Proteiniclasticum sediminis TaxID=2804028 RepID=A0A941CNS5_9CLOT|nr:N-acetylmuramic acid 6-phosphate etherase [Proteiniclasticum sediminis]MBR0575063.1 N-acetylmuramic acid 6-phosphate etherase [Proteiniclasticum sediminis]